MSSRGYKAWLHYEGQLSNKGLAKWADCFRSIICIPGERGGVLNTAIGELASGIEALTGNKPEVTDAASAVDRKRCIAAGIIGAMPLDGLAISLAEAEQLPDEGFIIRTIDNGDLCSIAIAGRSERGLMYGVFHFLRLLQTEGIGENGFNVVEQPAFRLRMLNQWDNMDGSVERGYAGRSIFYRNYELLARSPRIKDYARLLASVGINGIAINNVNVHRQETKLITERYLPDVARVADTFRAYGIRLYLSVNFAGPLELGELDTADPLDPRVQAWWKERANEVYSYVPDFGGFLVKADSENRPGPFTYGRDHADGANMLADALAPYGGIVLWRCFVYNCQQDWRDRSTDRAKAAYDHFRPLDGRFRDNVILQIKNGPMDFQVREPVSPLFGAMPNTNHMMEFQVTQEYTGQQRHVCFLVPQWKEVLDFDTRLKGEGTRVKDLAAGKVHPYTHCGVTAVSNIGDDDNWTGHHLAQSNLYGYGRLMWNPDLEAEAIAEEWTRQTFGGDAAVVETITGWLMESWGTYESYTAPLGVGWMVTPHYHYGPDVDGYEYSKWGTYHFADWKGIGVDRTQATGTGYTAQYEAENARVYENLATCPDELLLFFHHVPYIHKLHSGKTVIQHIYDTHFEGVQRVEAQLASWLSLEGKIDEERFRHVTGRAKEQLENAKLWRDVINTYFYRKSGISDEQGRTIY
ncbi:alpha-glucuronidase [Paenibacillus nanensis]|uniref:Xylan alpha-1,2-glucuronidase n=1 Tax=Paenibacillus nanensis TaxID=393251 RepID=A0A3A1UR71_9BACL|nr:alpha-glucuronidase family glycosyl hydrolase [Paenibacillus nanensis]RIX50745.1 alpha-glucuronidase [Paenibacillus nanensis]